MAINQTSKQFIKRVLRLNPVPVPITDKEAKELPNSALIPIVIEYIDKGHTANLPLKGNSMRPFLEHRRDMALLDSPKNIKVSDPVLAEVSPGHYVLHRLVSIKGDQVTLLGDGNLTPEHCTMQDIKALAIGFYRKGRKEPDLITSRKWRIYSWFWMRLLPIRRYLLMLHHVLFRSMKVLD